MSVHELVPTLRGNAHLGHVTADQSDLGRPSRHSQLRNANIGINNVRFINQRLSPVQLLFRILYLTSTSIGKHDEHYDAHSRAAWHCTPTAKAHHRARRTHKNAANRHEAHAQSNPIGANFHNSVAQQHRTEAKAHRGYKSIYSALSSEHDIVVSQFTFFGLCKRKKAAKSQVQQSASLFQKSDPVG